MLQSIRDSLQSQKWLAYVVVGALGLIFAVWGATGIVNLNFGGTSYAAEAGGRKITIEEARRYWLREQQNLGGAELPPELKARMQDQVLESLVQEALMAERTQDLGYRVTDQDVHEAIRSEHAFQLDGEFDPRQAEVVLRQNGLSIDTFEQNLRDELRQAQLERGIADSDFMTPGELERTRALEGQEREVRYAVLPADKFKPAAPPDEAIQAYYKAHQADYLIPESAHLQYGQLRVDQLAQQIQASDADLHAAYDKQKAQFVQPERRHAHHILITTGKDRDDAAALKLAQDILAQAKSGKDFEALAKQYSQDPGAAQGGGDLGWADRSSLVGPMGPFADALFGMSAGEVRGPVKTQYGYHIIRLDEVQPGKTKTFEEAKPELEIQVKKDRANDRFGEIQEQLQKAMEEPGANLDALAKQYNLQTGEVAQFERNKGGDSLGAAPQLQQLVFGDTPLEVGRLGGPVLESDERLIIVKVLDHKKPEAKPLAEVRKDIVAALDKERGTEAAMKAADAARAKLQAGASFDEIVKELNVSDGGRARFVGRDDPSILPELARAVFDSPRPAGKPVFQSVRLASGGAAVLEVTQVRTPDKPDKQQQATRTLQSARRNAMADVQAYIEQVRRSADVRKNPKAFE
jgi:peptidyl-prolyl cis-trans isomerase D